MKTLCITGWQQAQDALGVIAPEAEHLTYDDCASAEAFFAKLPKEAETAIGWSLGGQLLARAIAGGHLTAKKLVFIATPYRFKTDEAFHQLREMYRQQPLRAVKQFAALIATGDIQANTITRKLREQPALWKEGLFWLEELGRFVCESLNFSAFPPTLLIYGENDKILPPEQSRLFAEALPKADIRIIPGCGHAPHLHDAALMKQWIAEHV